jgi:hypothetical protein
MMIVHFRNSGGRSLVVRDVKHRTQALRDSVPRPLWLSIPLILAVLGFFLAFVGDPQPGPNLIAEAWGVFGAGIAVWWILESKSEQVQHRGWLRQNAKSLEGDLVQIRQAAQTTATRVAVALPPGLRGAPEEETQRDSLNLTWVEPVRLMLDKMQRETANSRWMLGRLPRLEMAICRYTEASERLLAAYSELQEARPFDIHRVPVTRGPVENHVFVLYCEAIALSNMCSDLLKEIGVRPD